MVTVYLCRHGETDFNKNGIIQGGGIDSDINENGYKQARALHRAYGSMPFAAIYASGLKRTHQTLSPWREAGAAIEAVPGLNEFNWGEIEGKRPDETQRSAFESMLKAWKNGDLHARLEGGESPLEAWDRSKAFFEMLKSDFLGETVLVCSHGRQIRIILTSVLGLGLREMHRFSTDNTGMHILKIYPGGNAHLEQVNDLTHLKALIV